MVRHSFTAELEGSQPVPLPPGSLMVGDLMLPPLMAGRAAETHHARFACHRIKESAYFRIWHANWFIWFVFRKSEVWSRPGILALFNLYFITGWEGAMGPRAPLRSLPEPPKHEPRRACAGYMCHICRLNCKTLLPENHSVWRLEEHQMLFPDMFHFARNSILK